MKITVASWFDKKTLKAARRVVSISGSEPRGAQFQHKIMELVPLWRIVKAIKAGEIGEDEYTEEYLAKILPHIEEAIAQLHDSDVLCCWEKKGDFCHRRIAAKVLADRDIEVQIE